MRGYLILPVDVNWVDYESEWEELLGPGFDAMALAELEKMAAEDVEQQELAEMGIRTEGGLSCE